MSFLTEVISAANKIEINTVTEKTPDLVLLVEETEKEFLDYLDNVFVKYSQPAGQCTHFREKVNSSTKLLSQLQESVTEVKKRDIPEVESKITSHNKKLLEVKERIGILECLVNIYDNLLSGEHLLNDGKYAETIELIRSINDDMEWLKFDEPLVILPDIQKQVCSLKAKLFTEMDDKVHEYINYSLQENNCCLKIQSNNSCLELLFAYKKWDDHIPFLNDIAKFLWDHGFYSIVCNTTDTNITSTSEEHKLDIQIIKEGISSNYKDTFKNIITVLDYLEEHFKYSLGDCTTLEYIGNDLRDNLSELLIKNCLNKTIPTNSEELKNYHVVTENVRLLQSKLVSSGIFTEGMTSLLDHANKVDEHYIKNKCQRYLKKAEDIMKKDLHNMVEVGEPVDLKNPFKINEDVFYQRAVSKSCVELLELAEDMLTLILHSVEPTGHLLYQTVQKIFAEYCDKVGEYHQKLLQTIPQQVALFLNNCYYLSYKLTSWDELHGEQLKQVLNIKESLFSSEVQMLMATGKKTFEEFIEQQIKQIEQILKESGLINISSLEELEPITEKCIRQCLRQQELLKTVWHKVLSYSDYNENLGITLNFLCKSIIRAILKLNDISSKAGDQLVDVLKVIFTRGPKLFTDQKDVFIYVEQWHKLKELSFVLSSNLVEITDRWADGKGPLALHFKAEELKQLIKALFQNTDRRAAVLAKIKDVY